MTDRHASVLLIGESDVGKTHYGAQLIRRLNVGNGAYALVKTESIKPFKIALEKISQGLSSDHTPSGSYTESVWRLRSATGREATLVWPDYAGEQISDLIDSRRLKPDWRNRILAASGWAFLVRPSQVPIAEDAITRSTAIPTESQVSSAKLTRQLRLVELLQMLRFVVSSSADHDLDLPPLAILLSCYDELKTDEKPPHYFRYRLPMLYQFVRSTWPSNDIRIFGLSALGQPLSKSMPDPTFVKAGPETLGYIVDEEGNQHRDLTLPLDWLIGKSDKS